MSEKNFQQDIVPVKEAEGRKEISEDDREVKRVNSFVLRETLEMVLELGNYSSCEHMGINDKKQKTLLFVGGNGTAQVYRDVLDQMNLD
jgi:hypothetical protein